MITPIPVLWTRRDGMVWGYLYLGNRILRLLLRDSVLYAFPCADGDQPDSDSVVMWSCKVKSIEGGDMKEFLSLCWYFYAV